jgi:hypothetical protein
MTELVRDGLVIAAGWRFRGNDLKGLRRRPLLSSRQLLFSYQCLGRRDWILYRPIRSASECAEGIFENDPLVVTFTLPLGFQAVVAGWLPLVALDAPFPTSCNVLSIESLC